MLKAILIVLVLFVFPASLSADQKVPEIKKDCKTCHSLNKKGTMVKLKLPINQLCLDCHSERSGAAEHAVDVKPPKHVRDLPLDKKGRMTCVTCHEPHGLTGVVRMLRARPSELCQYCHDK